jgi:hypothetical protein
MHSATMKYSMYCQMYFCLLLLMPDCGKVLEVKVLSSQIDILAVASVTSTANRSCKPDSGSPDVVLFRLWTRDGHCEKGNGPVVSI